MEPAKAHDYRDRAAELLAAYRPSSLERTIREQVLPALLG
jgi:hypothetical protein